MYTFAQICLLLFISLTNIHITLQGWHEKSSRVKTNLFFSGLIHQQKSIAKVHLEKDAVFASKKS